MKFKAPLITQHNVSGICSVGDTPKFSELEKYTAHNREAEGR